MEFKVVLFMPRDTASVPISRQVLNSCLETLGVTAGTRTDIALALSEACANAVLHAGAEQEYEVMARATNGRCVIEVANAGDGAVAAVPQRPRAAHGRTRPWSEDHRRGHRQLAADRQRPRGHDGAFREGT